MTKLKLPRILWAFLEIMKGIGEALWFLFGWGTYDEFEKGFEDDNERKGAMM